MDGEEMRVSVLMAAVSRVGQALASRVNGAIGTFTHRFEHAGDDLLGILLASGSRCALGARRFARWKCKNHFMVCGH